MIFPEDKLKIASKMLDAAWNSCPLAAAAAAGQHWMAVAHMLQVVLDYKEEVRSAVIDYEEGGENDAACDEGAG